MSDDFILVTKKSKRKSQKLAKLPAHRPISPVEIDENRILKQIHEIQIDLKTSQFIEKSCELLVKSSASKSIEEIICLGIGKISDCVIAKHQLAFLLIVQQQLKIQKKPKFYDPVLSIADRNILESLDCEILTENREGKYCVDHPTLFYLPHCPKQITNNLLYSNWSEERLENLVLICNSFKKIIESTPERLLRPNAHFLLEIAQFTSEEPLENCFKFTDIFNDFSIHTFSELTEAGENFWNNQSEPSYSSEELEFVKKDGDTSNQNVERNIE